MAEPTPVSAVGPLIMPAVPVIHDTWKIHLPEDRGATAMLIERWIVIDAAQADLLWGSTAGNPASLVLALEKSGARNSQCQQNDNQAGLSFYCRYQSPLAADGHQLRLALPDSRIMAFLVDIPVETAQAIFIQSSGQVSVEGFLTMLPSTYHYQYVNGGYNQQTFHLQSFSSLIVSGELFIPPGNLPAGVSFEPEWIAFAPNYMPAAAAWLALVFALFAALVALILLLPVGARLPRRPRLWQPDPDRYPFFLRWLVRLAAAVVNWLKQNWPRLFNGLVSLVLIGWGGQLLFLVWSIARVDGLLGSNPLPDSGLLSFLPAGDLVALLQKPGGLILMGLFGAGLVATGLGLLARARPARLLVVGALLALIGVTILLWPRFILAPTLFPFQLELVWILGGSILYLLVMLARWLMHPQFRRYYLRITESQ